MSLLVLQEYVIYFLLQIAHCIRILFIVKRIHVLLKAIRHPNLYEGRKIASEQSMALFFAYDIVKGIDVILL